jgi:2-oxoglutarate dehydrogenase E2 component (dihydrolipoamide succinyltransferase)
LVEEGKTVGVNTVVARIDEAGNGAKPVTPVKPATAAAPGPLQAPATVAQPAPAPPPAEPVEAFSPLSPLVRKVARENQIDLSQVQGTGAGGRITKQDLEAYLAQRRAPQAAAPVPAPRSVEAQPAYVPPAATSPARVRIETMSSMRQKIAEHMVMSKRTSAHVTTIHRADMTRVVKVRDRHKADFQARYGLSLTYLPFVVRGAVEALRTYPLVNASIEGTNILYHNEINIGIAVALDNGLIVPVIRNADEKNVLGLQRAIVDLAGRARSRQLKPDEVQGGTFSITNFGSFGSIMATPIINQPQVAILGVGAVTKEPIVIEDAIAIRSICYISLTFDHRLVDGALADQFTAKVKSGLESWSEEVL